MSQTTLPWPVRASSWVLVAFLVLPFLIVIPVSFTDRPYLSMPEHALSLQHYRNLIGDGEWQAAFLRSLVTAAISMVFSVLIGTSCAFGTWRLPARSATFVRTVVLLPLIVPGIVQALAFYKTWADFGLLNSYPGIVIAHTVTSIPLVFIAVSAALAHLDPRLEMASRSLGAGQLQTLRWVLVPVVMPGVLSGALFAFVHSFDELVVVLFITSRGIDTLPKKMWDTLEDDMTPAIACVAVLLGLLTLALLLLETFLRRRAEAVRTAGAPGAEPAAAPA